MDYFSLTIFQPWNAFGASTGNTPNDSFTFNTISQVAPNHFNVPSVPHAEARGPQVSMFDLITLRLYKG